MGDDYARPDLKKEFDIEIDEKFGDEKDKSGKKNAKNQQIYGFLKRINDKKLDEQVKLLMDNNFALRQSVFRLVQAGENIDIKESDFFPKVNNDNSATRTITPLNGLAGLPNFGSGKIYNTNYEVSVSASWQLDFFGKIRRATEKAKAEFEATRFDLIALRQSLIADLIIKRVNIASYMKFVDVMKENERNYKIIYDSAQKSFELGSENVNLTDLMLAKAAYNNASSQVENYQQLLNKEIFELEILLGKMPKSMKINKKDFALLKPLNENFSCLRADLLDRRPDLIALENRLKAANADIGVAIADMFPDFTISASTGYRGNQFRSLINSDQLASSLMGSIQTKLFQGGALLSNMRYKKAVYKELALNYAENILNAVKEVETLLDGNEKLKKRLNLAEKSYKASTVAQKSAQNRYNLGILALREFLEIKAQNTESFVNLLNLYQLKWQNQINLYLALGGDWFNEKSQLNKCRK